MSNYQEGSGSYRDDATAGASPGYQQVPAGGAYQGGQQHQDTSQFQSAGHQHWEGQQGHSGGPGHQGFFQGGNRMASPGRRGVNVRSTFKTTEFWVLVIVSLALLIAAAVTDQGTDSQGFGAHDAWKYVTWLSIAYILSRGLTKFAGHERGDRTDHDHR